MKRCPSCDGRYEKQRLVCPIDADVLVSEGTPSPDTGRVLDGRYRLGNLIGEGGMGQVFEAVDLEANATVAVKLLKAGTLKKNAEKRFRLEAEAMNALKHPGTVRMFDFRQPPEGGAYIVMERLCGPTFSELRRAGKFASPERVLLLMREACSVVGGAHEQGIVHRDLKPSNLVLHRIDPARSQVKVLDFGIAKFMDRVGEGLTLSGEMVGTLLYMAPEQGSGRAVTPATDVYSLGVVMFEGLAGRHPFNARSAAELMWMQASAPVPALSSFRPDVSSDLDDIVARCLAKKPQNRYADAGELARALSDSRAMRPSDASLSSTRTLRVNPSLWVGSVLDERYELHEWVAPGRFRSHVYRATHLHTGTNVAVRVWRTGKGAVRDFLIEAFRNEAKAMGVRHPNLIAIVDLGFTDECVYIVTEFVESLSLRALLQSQRALGTATAARLIRGAAQALEALHTKGIVSGGLSPETMRVTGPTERPGSLLLSPLGLRNLKQADALLDPAGDPEGDRMRDYMAPEQRSGQLPDLRSDLCSLGLVLIEMLGGRVHELFPVLAGTSAGEPAERALGTPIARAPGTPVSGAFTPVLPDGLSEEWKEFLVRATAPAPSDRFATAAEFLAAIPAA
jgi:serine/threonine protein kinase